MRRLYLLLIALLIVSNSFAVDFNQFFINRTLRIDYFHVGDKTSDEIVLDLIYKEGQWAGNPSSLIDSFNNGKYYYKVYDLNSNELIYARGFNNYFGEYQTTEPAKKGIKRAYHETAILPFPKNKILFVLEKRDQYNTLSPIYKKVIDPSDYHIINKDVHQVDYVYEAQKSGDAHKCLDIAMIGEGYTQKEKRKFQKDVKRYTKELLEIAPFKEYKDEINIRGVLRYSQESGVDEPRQNQYRNTILDATFNSFDSPRYLLTENNKMLHDIAAQVPYDAIIILANIDRYGGGGIYNFYSISTANESAWNEYVFLHEFGHSFAGLADEYYSSNVAYDDFYPEGIEPTEPNITRLMDPENLKWKAQVSAGIGIPTNWGKEKFDSMNVRIGKLYQEQRNAIARLKEEAADDEKIKACKEKYSEEIAALRKSVKDFMANHPLRGKVGAFEGAGYNADGMYRPTLNSIMHQFTDQDKGFYPVNTAAIEKMIRFYTD